MTVIAKLLNCGNFFRAYNYQPCVATYMGQRVTPEIW
nr:MAG TPA_asm: hypothetical protein [Caudoviricetes sp.]